ITMQIDSGIKGSKYYNSRWERYGSYYYYNQLSSDQKKVYNMLNTQCLKLLTSSVTVENLLPKSMSGNGRSYYFLDPIDYGNLDISEKDALTAFRFFRYSNPQYFFLSGAELGFNGTGIFAVTIYDEFRTYSGRKAAIDAMNETIDAWDVLIDEQDTEEEKVRMIHDLICKRVDYNDSAVDNNYINDGNEYTQSMYSALGWSEKKTVCAGYSYAFQYLANKYGIDCVCVTSVSTDPATGEEYGGHQWNAVRVEDQWYMIDLTWDDDPMRDGSIPIAYYCYLRSLKKINALVEADENDENHHPESFYGKKLPSCVKDSAPTVYEPGEIFEPESRVKAPVITVNSKNKKVSIKSKTKNVTIYYTTDGNAPSPASTKSKIYKSAFKVKKGQVIRTVAVRSGYYDSKITKKKVKF
ncbi:MAG: chitobiase/beta-hexosaminidase C-terminal domain-containing protein, partial [Lachnospiraceae bacterium]|nr:chitobiase/beta-hexosaminidase C-terminal domain-containing protein [Lachnospiraceae bacterium]